jgi:hypothetical protein
LPAATRSRGAQAQQQRLGREGGVLEVVHQQVVEQRLALVRDHGRALQHGGEVHEVEPVDHLLVLAQERGELVPAGESAVRGGLLDPLRR